MIPTVLNSNCDSKVRNTGLVLRGVDVADAEQLYSLLGLLIIEGRCPADSPKGRVVGPHAYKGTDGKVNHVCDNSQKCQMAAQYRDQLVSFGRHKIPLTVEVLILPDCDHYDVTSNQCVVSFDSRFISETNKYSLLEQWTIQLTQRRLSDNIEPLTALLNTVYSYLHFSQLSAWLIENNGQKPRNIFYRLAVPRESSLPVMTPADYQHHNLPRIGAGESSVLEVSLLALKRQPHLPSLLCPKCHFNVDAIPPEYQYDSHVSIPTTRLTGQLNCSKRPQTLTQYMTQDQSPRVQLRVESGRIYQQFYPETSKLGTTINTRKKAYSESIKQRWFCGDMDLPMDTPFYYQESFKNECPSSLSQEQSRKLPATSTAGRSSYRNSQEQQSSYKDLTPYPKKESLEAVLAEFTHLNVSCDSNGSKHRITSNSNQGENSAVKKLLFDASAPHEFNNRDSRKKKRERRILFSDSSSSESLDRIPPQRVSSLGCNNCSSIANSMESLLDSTELPYYSAGAPTSVVTSNATTCSNSYSTAPLSPLVTSDTSCSSHQNGSSHSNSTSNGTIASNGVSSHSTTEAKSSIKPAVIPSSTADNSTSKVQPAKSSSKTCYADPIALLREKIASRDAKLPGCPASVHSGASLYNQGHNLFNKKTGLPLRSSPAPLKRNSSGKFDYDESVKLKSVKSAQYMTDGSQSTNSSTEDGTDGESKSLSASAPATTTGQHLIVNFEESMLNGRIHPIGVVEGFSIELGASGAFCPAHVRLPLIAYFFQLSDDNAPSPYLGYVDLAALANKRGYHVPKKGSLQLTLFNPSGTVLKMFVVLYDLSDMPANSQTFLRQRTLYMPVHSSSNSSGSATLSSPSFHNKSSSILNQNHSTDEDIPSPNLHSKQQRKVLQEDTANGKQNDSNNSDSFPAYLRYLVHLRFHTTKSNKLYLHTDIRLIFSRDKFEFDPRISTYELRSFVEAPINPRYSPKK